MRGGMKKFLVGYAPRENPTAQLVEHVQARAFGGALVAASSLLDAKMGRDGYRLVGLLLDEEPWPAPGIPAMTAAAPAAAVTPELPF